MTCNVIELQMSGMTISAANTTAVFVATIARLSATGCTGARARCELQGRAGELPCQPAVGHSNDIRSAGTAVAISSFNGTISVSDPSGDVELTLGSSKFIRAGWLVSAVSGLKPAGGRASGVVQLLQWSSWKENPHVTT